MVSVVCTKELYVFTRSSPMAALSSLQARVFILLVFRLWSLDSTQSEALLLC